MTPDELRAALLHALQPLARWVADNAAALERVDQAVTDAGQRLADEAEQYANEGASE